MRSAINHILFSQNWEAPAVNSPIGIIPDEDRITKSGEHDVYEPAQIEVIRIDKLHCTLTTGGEDRPPIRWTYRLTVTVRLAGREQEDTWFLGETTFLNV